jgi:hypothetical protein
LPIAGFLVVLPIWYAILWITVRLPVSPLTPSRRAPRIQMRRVVHVTRKLHSIQYYFSLPQNRYTNSSIGVNTGDIKQSDQVLAVLYSNKHLCQKMKMKVHRSQPPRDTCGGLFCECHFDIKISHLPLSAPARAKSDISAI